MIALGKLWGAIGLFHPYLAYRPINWDSALVLALPLADRATTRADFAAAVARMLAPLGDPVTRVLPKQPAPAPATAGVSPALFLWLSDSILAANFGVAGHGEDLGEVRQRLAELRALMATARGLILDFRVAVGNSELDQVEWFLSGIDSILVADTLYGPGQRSRTYSGWAPELGMNGGEYYAAWKTVDGTRVLPGQAARRIPVVVLANANSTLPASVVALMGGGRAHYVVEGSPPPIPGMSATRFVLPDSLTVEVRLSEAVSRFGRSGEPVVEVIDESTALGEANPALQAALRIARGGRAAATTDDLPLPAVAVAQSPRPYPYAEASYPTLEYRRLAAFRIFTIMEYFHPYRDLYEEDWDQVLRSSLPQFEAARDSTEYALAVSVMVSRIHDSHGFINSEVLETYRGARPTTVRVRYIEHLPVIVGFINDSGGRPSDARVGDVILTVDGAPAAERFALLARTIAASTPQALEEVVGWYLLNGPGGTIATVEVRGADGRNRRLELPRQATWEWPGPERQGDILRFLPGNIGYADLDRLTVTMVDSMFDMFRHTKAIIFDMRGYPHGTADAIAPRLTDRNDVPRNRFARPVADHPRGSTSGGWRRDDRTTFEFTIALPRTDGRRYHGRTVMLIDGRTASQAEGLGMFFEAANGTVFIGSPTAGSNGDVTNFYVPGGIRIWFSGQGVRHADGRQLQRVGLQPAVLATPTIAGVRAGRDEVLERALAYLGVTKGVVRLP